MSFAAPRGTELFDIMGHERSFDKNADGSDRLRLSIFPVFLRAASADELAAALKSAKWKSNAPILPKVKFAPVSAGKFSVSAGNPYTAEMRGKIGLRGDSQNFAIAENDSRKFVFSAPAKITDTAIKKFAEKISLSLASPVKRDFTYAKSFRALLVKNTREDFGEIGKNWDKWEGVPPISLDNIRRSEKLWSRGINPTAEQFSARYKILRDADKLRIAVFVRDDKFLEADGDSADAGARADAVEIIFDTLADAADTPEERRLGADDWHFKIWKTKGSDEAKVYRLSVPDVQLTLGILGAKVHTFADDVRGAFRKTDGGYMLELEFEATAMLPQKLAASAAGYVEYCEGRGFHDLVVSAKAHDVMTTVRTYRQLSRDLPHIPLHIGITEAGTQFQGVIKSASGLGILLEEGIGDTMRISLTDDPVVEMRACWALLSALDLRRRGPEIISCPTCGRCQVNLIELAKQVESNLMSTTKPIKVAVMGCVVNGPGEARDADIGVACGAGVGVVFKHGEVQRKVEEHAIVDVLMEEIGKL